MGKAHLEDAKSSSAQLLDLDQLSLRIKIKPS